MVQRSLRMLVERTQEPTACSAESVKAIDSVPRLSILQVQYSAQHLVKLPVLLLNCLVVLFLM